MGDTREGAANTAERNIHGMNACHREQTRTSKRIKSYAHAWCPQASATNATSKSKRKAKRGTAPDARRPSQRRTATPPRTASHHPRGTQPAAGHAHQRDSAGPPRPHTRAHSKKWVADPDSPL